MQAPFPFLPRDTTAPFCQRLCSARCHSCCSDTSAGLACWHSPDASVLPSTTTRLGLWSRMREVRSNAIDGSARALFRDARTSFNAHAVAVSSLDGKAYVTTLDRGKAIGYCCHHPKSVPITCLAPAPGRDRAAADCLLAGCKDGSVLLVGASAARAWKHAPLTCKWTRDRSRRTHCGSHERVHRVNAWAHPWCGEPLPRC